MLRSIVSRTIFRYHSSKATACKPLTVTFITPENEAIECKAAEGENLLEIAHQNDVELEGTRIMLDINVKAHVKHLWPVQRVTL